MSNTKILNNILKKKLKTNKYKNKLTSKIITIFNLNINNLLYILVVYNIISIFYISGIIYYIRNTKDCSCFEKVNEVERVNITYIYIIEIIMLILYIILTIITLFLIFKVKTLSGGNKSNNISKYIMFIITLIIDSYFIYNVYKLSKIDNKCDCSKNNLKILLYIQTIVILLGLLYKLFMIVNNFI